MPPIVIIPSLVPQGSLSRSQLQFRVQSCKKQHENYVAFDKTENLLSKQPSSLLPMGHQVPQNLVLSNVLFDQCIIRIWQKFKAFGQNGSSSPRHTHENIMSKTECKIIKPKAYSLVLSFSQIIARHVFIIFVLRNCFLN